MSRLFRILLLTGILAAAGAAQDLQLFIHTPGSSSDGVAFGGNYSFPDTAAGDTSSVTFRLKNISSTTAYLVLSVNFSPGSAFSAQGTYALKCLAPSGSNEDFTVVFAPPAASPTPYQDNLQISYVPYPGAQGCTGSIPDVTPVSFGTFYGTGTQPVISPGGGGDGTLNFSYTDTSGASHALSSGTTVNFGNVQMGSSQALQFTLSNPSTSTGAVSVPQIVISGNAFSIQNALPTPDSIQPGSSASFSVVFAPVQAATPTFTGTLSIGSQSVALAGTGISQAFPTPALSINTTTIQSQQQDTISVTLPSAAPYSTSGNLTLTFTPTVSGVTSDPAVFFTSTSGTTITVEFAQGAESGTFNNQTAIGFQTGTTAGTLTFTFTMGGKTVATQSYTITPQLVQFSTQAAVTDDPNLVISLTGFDNTYSAGKLTFTFYGSNGTILTPGGMVVDATSTFQQYFHSGSGYGGAFSMQATFPVAGTITQNNVTTWAGAEVTSVDVTMQNSAGTSQTQHIVFQSASD